METHTSFLPLWDSTEMTAPLNRSKISTFDPMVDLPLNCERVTGHALIGSKEHARRVEEAGSSRNHSFRPEDRGNATIDGGVSRGHRMQKMPALGILFPSQQEGSKGLIGIERREFLELAGIGSILIASSLDWQYLSDAALSWKDDFFFVQLSYTHGGSSGPAVRPDATWTRKKAIVAVGSLEDQPISLSSS